MEHDWKKTTTSVYLGPQNKVRALVCAHCGITKTIESKSTNCPPWASMGEGDTNASRVREGKGIKELKTIHEMLLDCASLHYVQPWRSVALRQKAMDRLWQLIQKREGLDQS